MERKTKNPMINVGPGSNPEPNEHNPTADFPMIIVMIAVLAIILLFCFWGAPGVRAFCRRKICYRCPMDEPRESSGTPRDDRSTTPTIILLPFGRMLVVDRTVISQLQADQTGIDFMELSANLIRAHHLRCGSTPSILDSETTSKGLSPISLGFSPPSYEDIFGEKNNDLPPSYSELSLLFRQRQMDSSEMQSFNIGSLTARNNAAVQETILDVNENVEEVCDVSRNEGNEIREEESKPIEENQISVPSNLRVNDLPRVPNSIPANLSEQEDFSYPNCRYCVMSFENERSRAKIKCYCYEGTADSNSKCVLMSRPGDDQASSSTNENSERSVVQGSADNVTNDNTRAIVRNCASGSSDSLNVKNCSDKCDSNGRNLENEGPCDRRRSCDDIRESRL